MLRMRVAANRDDQPTLVIKMKLHMVLTIFLANNIVPPSGDESIFDYMKAPVTDSMFLFDTDELEIAKIV